LEEPATSPAGLPGRLGRSVTPGKPHTVVVLTIGAAVVGSILWAYWTTLTSMARKWSIDPQYSHGYLVPLFSVALLWLRRPQLNTQLLRSSWWGIVFIAAAIGLRLGAVHFYLEWFDALSLLPMLVGGCLLAGGWHAVRWAWPSILFLFFMCPLPFRLEVALQSPLRSVGTVSSVYVMQTLGMPAFAEGNVIALGDVRIGVAEACSGLRMLMIFFALTTAVAIVSSRPLWERLVIWVSAVPIAIVTNIVRITVTGSLYAMDLAKLAELVFHDLAGWLMMPFALFLLWGEFWVLSHLIIDEEGRPIDMGLHQETSS
jgi:exosortase